MGHATGSNHQSGVATSKLTTAASWTALVAATPDRGSIGSGGNGEPLPAVGVLLDLVHEGQVRLSNPQ
jgi:hypothetical protein